MNILAIITARGGSKGIPQKNMRKINGKPLIEYSIKTAKSSKFVNKILVSTDDKKTANFSKSKNIEVPFLRPKKLAQSKSRTIDVINHTLEFLKINEKYIPDIITILQPTSPLRSVTEIDKSIQMLKNNKTISSVLGVVEVKNHPFLCFKLKNSFLSPYKSDFQKFYQRQKFPSFYYPTGSIYTFWNKTLTKYGNIYGPKIKPLKINIENSIDIDTSFDLFQTEMRLIHWNNFLKKYNKGVN